MGDDLRFKLAKMGRLTDRLKRKNMDNLWNVKEIECKDEHKSVLNEWVICGIVFTKKKVYACLTHSQLFRIRNNEKVLYTLQALTPKGYGSRKYKHTRIDITEHIQAIYREVINEYEDTANYYAKVDFPFIKELYAQYCAKKVWHEYNKSSVVPNFWDPAPYRKPNGEYTHSSGEAEDITDKELI